MPPFWSARERPAGSGAPRCADSTPAASAAAAPDDEVADRFGMSGAAEQADTSRAETETKQEQTAGESASKKDAQ